MKQRIYISGKITGCEHEDAFVKFARAEAFVNATGYEAVNPMKLVGCVAGKTWAEYMAEDIILLDACAGIYMLNDWRDSDGAKIEHAIAEIRGKSIWYEGTNLQKRESWRTVIATCGEHTMLIEEGLLTAADIGQAITLPDGRTSYITELQDVANFQMQPVRIHRWTEADFS